MNFLFTVCGRAGSKGVKSKNLRSLRGIPLVYYSLSVIARYQQLHPEHTVKAAISTDSEELIELACRQKTLPILVVRRDGYLAGDTAPKVAAISHCLLEAERQLSMTFDALVDLDITSPLRTVSDVENAINERLKYPELDCVFSVTTPRRNPFFNMVKLENHFSTIVIPSTYTTRQDSPAVFDMNGSIYAYSPTALKEKNCIGFFNSNCASILMKDTAVIDIDSEEDLELMELLAGYFFEKYDAYGKMQRDALSMAQSAGEVQ